MSGKRLSAGIVSCALSSVCLSSGPASGQTFNWIGGPSGDWTQVGGWDNGLPDGPTDDVFIDATALGVAVDLDSDRTVRDVNIGDTDILDIEAARTLTVHGSIVNDGQINLQGVVGLNAQITVQSTDTVLGGDGLTTTLDSGNNRVEAGFNGAKLTIGADHTFSGSGFLGGGTNLGIVNNGLILADNPNNGLTINPGGLGNAEGAADFINNGTIRNTSEQDLLLTGGLYRNNGTIENLDLTGSSNIVLTDIILDNTLGAIDTGFGGGNVILDDNTELRGGTLDGFFSTLGTTGFPSPNAVSTNVVIADVTLTGGVSSALNINSQSEVTLEGGFNLPAASHRIIVNAPPNAPQTRVAIDNVTLSGLGSMDLFDEGALLVNPVPGTPTSLTIEDDFLIDGIRGGIGDNDNLGVINRGTIQARNPFPSGPTAFTIDLGTGANVDGQTDLLNEGTLQVVGDARMVIANTQIDNTLGVIDGGNGTVILDDNSELRGGTLDGFFSTLGTTGFPSPNAVSTNVVIADVTLTGGLSSALNINSQSEVTLEGGFNLPSASHRIIVNAPPDSSETRVAIDNVTLSGLGSMDLFDEGALLVNVNPAVATSLTIEEGFLVDGIRGGIGDNDNLGVINRGTIQARNPFPETSLTFTFNPGLGGNIDGTTDVVNEGTLRSIDVSEMVLLNATVRNDGVIEARDGGTVTFGSNTALTNRSGGLLFGGTYIGHGGAVDLGGAAFTTLGSTTEVVIGADGDVTAGGLSLGASLTSSAGTLRILDGADAEPGNDFTNAGLLELGVGSDYGIVAGSVDFTQTAAGTLLLQLGGTGNEVHGQIAMSGDVSLAGTLELLLADGYVPTLGDTLAVITGDTVTGTFDALVQPIDMPAGLAFDVNVFPALVELQVIAAGIAGDYNNSGQVEQADLDFVLQNWGVDTSGNNIPSGWTNDLPDGLIDQAELDGVLLNWGDTGTPPDLRGFAVPEPTLALPLLLAGLLKRRRA